MQIIVFTIGKKYYGLNTNLVEEIISKDNPKMVPNSPEWVEGLINLRGNVVTTVNLSKLLSQEDNLCYNNIIIINIEEEKLGILINDVVEVINIETEDIENINKDTSHGILGITRINGKLINIVDINTLILKNEG